MKPADDAPADDAKHAESLVVLADLLTPMFYEDLKRVAHRERRRVGAGNTMQTTALVNESYLKLRGTQDWHSDVHFMRAAALAMRHALLNHAIARMTQKRGGGAETVSLEHANDVSIDEDAALVDLNEALERLAGESHRLAQVVECRYFAGYDDVDTAHALGISERTVRRDWALARAWLHRELRSPAL